MHTTTAPTNGTGGTATTVGPGTEVHFHPWWESDLALNGHTPDDPYVERFWLPAIGPAALVTLRHVARELARHPQGVTIEVADLAGAVGLGRGGGTNGPVARAVDRLAYFGLARRIPDAVMMRTHVPTLPERLLRRLPPGLRHEHVAIERGGGSTGPRPTVRSADDP